MPSFFADSQRELMTSILNRVVPPSGAFPGAGDLGIANDVDRMVGRSPELRRLFTQGLAHIAIVSQQRWGREFTGLSDVDKDAVLRHVEISHAAFFNALVTHTYSGYYSSPIVVQLLGLEAQSPQPRGYELEPLDLSLLESVKHRGQKYRPAL
jgi:hypothetical protein